MTYLDQLKSTLEWGYGTPAMRYLWHRNVWPQTVQTSYFSETFRRWDFPQDVGYSKDIRSVCFSYRNADKETVSLETDRLTEQGLLTDERKRRSYGSRHNSCFLARPSLTGTFHICEGPIDAIALLWKTYLDGVIAIGGTSGKPYIPKADRLIFHADGDIQGQKAMKALCRDYQSKVDCETVYYDKGHDPASVFELEVLDKGWDRIVKKIPASYASDR